ncbi:hypothetical protein NSQ77_01440 [Oceanobacillus sp. FSL K6-2867]
MSNKYYSIEFKYEVIKEYKNEEYSIGELGARYGVPDVYCFGTPLLLLQ